jgi:hypothetical protein
MENEQMGYYINPKDMSKEKFLEKNGTLIDATQASQHVAGDKLVVCLVDNFQFTAAGIAYNDRERDAFLYPDGRDKKWYLVDKSALIDYL